ncbi:MAG: 3-isopropylmalate dehydratase small subunit [Pseudomonadota bacterium]
MQKFTTLTSPAAPLPIVNVDTDMIIPKQFLKTTKRTGLSRGLFYEMRFDEVGNPKDGFVLDHPHYEKAEILIAGANFGCGSSREHAPWALLDHGIRCVISESFADIFYHNCFKNGILPVRLHGSHVDVLMDHAHKGANAVFTVDLPQKLVTAPDGFELEFDVDPFHQHCLINGLDHIALTMEKDHHIDSFENSRKLSHGWVEHGHRSPQT